MKLCIRQLRGIVLSQLLIALIAFGWAQAIAAEGAGASIPAGGSAECTTEASRALEKQCAGHAICGKAMLMRDTCPKLQSFMGNLNRVASGKKSINGSDVFDALSPAIKSDDAAFYNAAQAIKDHCGKQAGKEILTGTDADGKSWVYEGPALKRERHGTGVLLMADGTMFRGDFNMGRQLGRGEKIGKDGERIVGNMFDMKASGQGAIRYANGARYDGGLDKDIFSGNGVLVILNDFTYEGEFLKGLRNGTGTYRFPDGAQYKGGWINENREGQGRLDLVNGDSYVGEWAADKKHGRGIFTWKNGDRYEGEWSNNKKFNGVSTLADGSRVVFRNGKIEKQALEEVNNQYSLKIGEAEQECLSKSGGCAAGCGASAAFDALLKKSTEDNLNDSAKCLQVCSDEEDKCKSYNVSPLEQEKSREIERVKRDYR